MSFGDSLSAMCLCQRAGEHLRDQSYVRTLTYTSTLTVFFINKAGILNDIESILTILLCNLISLRKPVCTYLTIIQGGVKD